MNQILIKPNLETAKKNINLFKTNHFDKVFPLNTYNTHSNAYINTQKNKLSVEFSNELGEIPVHKTKHSKFNTTILKQYLLKNKYRLQFFASIIVAIVFLFILYYHLHKTNTQEQLSKELLNNYTLTTLYQNKTSDSVELQKQATFIENPFVIGMIKINKINLNYPILSESNYDLLKISLCRFAGPMPNENGNLCIAGHNYVDYKLFSRLAELEKSDLIELYDLSGRKVTYAVFDKYEVSPNDLSCTNQDVGENRILTLLTCNNVNGKRTVVKAKDCDS